jgi:hypothetical protein
MQSFIQSKTTTLLFLIPLVLGCFALSRVAEAGPAPAPPNNPQNVKVVNTAADWLAPVPSAQSGTWNVGVTNTAASPVAVRDVDNPAKQPFQAEVVGGFADGASTTGDIIIATVPAGKRLVIEYVSASGAMLHDQKVVRGEVAETLTLAPARWGIQYTPQGSNADRTRDYFVATQPVRIYADPGSITCSAERDSVAGANPDSVTFTISGYFVDCPTCVP